MSPICTPAMAILGRLSRADSEVEPPAAASCTASPMGEPSEPSSFIWTPADFFPSKWGGEGEEARKRFQSMKKMIQKNAVMEVFAQAGNKREFRRRSVADVSALWKASSKFRLAKTAI